MNLLDCRVSIVGASNYRTSVPGSEAPVWLCESSLSWSGEKYGADRDAVCAAQFVDGSQAIFAFGGRSAPVKREKPGKTPKFHCQRSDIVYFSSVL